jgi:hypothetical protein
MTSRQPVAVISFVTVSAAVTFASAVGYATGYLDERKSGIYVEVPGKTGDAAFIRLTPIEPLTAAGQMSMNPATAMGFGSTPIHATYSGAKAAIRVSSDGASFEFRLADPLPKKGPKSMADVAAMADALEGLPPDAKKAQDFFLVRFKVNGGQREAQVGQVGRGYSGKSKDAVEFVSEVLGPKAFRVKPKAPLPPGEYGFYFGPQTGSQVWDFGVDK